MPGCGGGRAMKAQTRTVPFVIPSPMKIRKAKTRIPSTSKVWTAIIAMQIKTGPRAPYSYCYFYFLLPKVKRRHGRKALKSQNEASARLLSPCLARYFATTDITKSRAAAAAEYEHEPRARVSQSSSQPDVPLVIE
ncbi:uncharacterized protein RAG0_11673 [Rhynchosporium agropyri]|uniref:Uncharacterized protein n=1 Tax=Rhynchosporium agropyri TaxID=914238 RepID=A0A1E1L5D3_9HELO|nr:uncharacterized protein RAG0_11673 [Rhynchosporium agropyri]